MILLNFIINGFVVCDVAKRNLFRIIFTITTLVLIVFLRGWVCAVNCKNFCVQAYIYSVFVWKWFVYYKCVCVEKYKSAELIWKCEQHYKWGKKNISQKSPTPEQTQFKNFLLRTLEEIVENNDSQCNDFLPANLMTYYSKYF